MIKADVWTVKPVWLACQLEKNLPVKTLLCRTAETEEGSYPRAYLELFEMTKMCKECLHKPCKNSCPYDAIEIKKLSSRQSNEQKCSIECAQSDHPCVRSCPYQSYCYQYKSTKMRL